MPTKWANQHKRSRNFYGGLGSPLSNEQKARICIVAREAFEAALNGRNFLPSSVPNSARFEAWRQHEQFLAVGKESLCDCAQSDYLALVAHFQNLGGESGRALKNHLRDQLQERAVARRKLEESCQERDLRLEYAEAICKRQFKCSIDEANAKQLWNLTFTVRNRRKPVKREMECPF